MTRLLVIAGGLAVLLVLAATGLVLLLTRDRGPRDGEGSRYLQRGTCRPRHWLLSACLPGRARENAGIHASGATVLGPAWCALLTGVPW